MSDASDMTKREFDAACKRRGFKPVGNGYYDLGLPGIHLAPILNHDTRRAQLAYLIKNHKESEQFLDECKGKVQ